RLVIVHLDAAAAARDGPSALSRGVAAYRVAREPVPASTPAGGLERAQHRSGDAGHRSHRTRYAGDPGSAARAGARLPVLADVPHDPVLLECAAVGVGPLVWRPEDQHLSLGAGAGVSAVGT